MNRASSPAEGRIVLAMMRDALAEAKVGLQATRSALESTRAQLAAERAELETIRRRGRLAAQIHDEETVRVAAQFEKKSTDRVAVLERKLAAQEAELELVEREVAEMTAQYQGAAAGTWPAGAGAGAAPMHPMNGTSGRDAADADALRREIDARAREADAERRLAELKRRMGK
ncbi:MAG TPA: hypothetical protein VFJ96_05955 [Gemmatimonadaceae bacterium]|jgi:hypothetical protein|nr:hypothetical protein [Gemmatimonadaceae bacterium]